MRQIKFDHIFKLLCVAALGYFLFTLTEINKTLKGIESTGRYQFDANGTMVIDTKTGETHIQIPKGR